jgi:hypothetical protein
MKKKGSKEQKGDFDIVKTVNEIGREVGEILESSREEKYFEEIMLLYSLIENLLKWLIFVEICRGKNWGEDELNKKDIGNLRHFCGQLRFYDALNVGLSIHLISVELYGEMEKVRKERSDVTHQLWIYQHRREPIKLRKDLEMLVGVAKKLAGVTERIINEVDTYEVQKMRL